MTGPTDERHQPPNGSSRPSSTRNRVDLPAPLGPMIGQELAIFDVEIHFAQNRRAVELDREAFDVHGRQRLGHGPTSG